MKPCCRKRARNYAASGLKLVDTPRPGKRANTLTAETHTNRCSSTSSLARSISTFFLAASLVQARKHAEERASMYSRTPASYVRFRSLQIGQSIPAPLRRSAAPTVAWMRSWVQKLPKSMGRRFGSLAYETGRIRLCRVARSRMPHGLRSVKATTFRKESRIADMGLVILCKFGLSLRAGDGRKAGQAHRVV